VLKITYFMIVADSVFCLGCAYDKQMHLTGVRLW